MGIELVSVTEIPYPETRSTANISTRNLLYWHQAGSIKDGRITKLLRLPGSWKCSCKTTTNVHTDRCQLRMPGERRWPGKNKGVSEEDWKFYAAETAERKKSGKDQD